MCVFCLSDAVEIGGEHIWDAWLNDALPEMLYRAVERPTLDSPAIEYDANRFKMKLPVVCRACNNEWMSALSLKIKDRFSRSMLDGEPFSLGTKDGVILAAFVFMKAALMNQSLPGAFFTRDARERFRTDLILPPFVQCWFTAYEGAARMHTRSQSHIFSPNPGTRLYGLQFFCFNYIVGKLALQLLAVRWKNIPGARSALIMLDAPKNWNLAAPRFWPDPGIFISWPPPECVGDNMIELFVQRFGAFPY